MASAGAPLPSPFFCKVQRLATSFPEPAEPASLTRSTMHGVFWMTATSAIKIPLTLVTVAVLARLLTPADFGIIAVATLLLTLADVLVDGSFGMVLIQRRTIDSAIVGASLALSIALAVLFGGAVILGAPLIEREFDFPELADVLLVLGAIMPLTAVTAITTALLQRAFRFRALTINAFVSQLVYSSVAIALAFAGLGLWSLVWAQLALSVVHALMGVAAVRNEFRISISAPALRGVLDAGGMFTISKLLSWGAYSVDRLIIGRLLGPVELGFYSRALTLMTSARQLTGTGSIRVLFSSFSKIQHDLARVRSGYLRALSANLILAALVSAFAIVNAEVIVRIMLGPQWLAAVPLIQALFAAFIAHSGYLVAESVPLAFGLSGQSALRQAVQVCLVMAGAAIGAHFGVVEAALGVAAAYWLFYLLCLVLVKRLLRHGWLEIVRLHLNTLAVALAPVVAALAARWLLDGRDIATQLVTALVFAVTATVALSLAPAGLLGEDLAKARARVWTKLSSHLPGPGRRG